VFQEIPTSYIQKKEMYLAVAQGSSIVLYGAGSYERLREIRFVNTDAICCCTFREVSQSSHISHSSNDGKCKDKEWIPGRLVLAVGSVGGYIRFCVVSEGMDEPLGGWCACNNPIQKLQFSADGNKLLVVGASKGYQDISLWNLSTRDDNFVVRNIESAGIGTAFAGEQTIAHVDVKNGVPYVTYLNRGEASVKRILPEEACNLWVNATCDRVARYSAAESCIELYDMGRATEAISRHAVASEYQVHRVVFSSDNQIIAAFCSQDIIVIETSTGVQVVIRDAVGRQWKVVQALFDPSNKHIAIALRLVAPSAWWNIQSWIYGDHEHMLVVYEVCSGTKITEAVDVGVCVAFSPAEVILM
jgi:WD40 repeat protein